MVPAYIFTLLSESGTMASLKDRQRQKKKTNFDSCKMFPMTLNSISFFYKKIYFCLFPKQTHTQRRRDRDTFLICWFTPQNDPQQPKLEQAETRSQDLAPHGCKGSKTQASLPCFPTPAAWSWIRSGAHEVSWSCRQKLRYLCHDTSPIHSPIFLIIWTNHADIVFHNVCTSHKVTFY